MGEGSISNNHVIVGRALSARGMRGDISVEVISDSPSRFSSGGILYFRDRPHRIERCSKVSGGRVMLKLEGIDSRHEAESLRHSFLTVPEDMVPPPQEGSYYHFQIIDMRVFSGEGEYLGQISQILPTGSNDVYVVSNEGRDLLVPALDWVIVEVDVERRRMTVDLPEGLRAGG